MAKRRNREEIIITYVPYGSKEAGLTDDSLNSPREFDDYFKNSLKVGKGQKNSTRPSVYIYPRIQDISETLAKSNFEVLTQSPVVYVVTFNQTNSMMNDKWLAKLVGDRARDTYRLYKRPYVVYIGETNNILARTNQHLTSRGHFGNVGGEESYEDINEEIDERTLADRVIQAAVHSKISVNEYIVWDKYFTKSMTLDIENKFIDYFQAHDDVYVLNSRGNPQRNYYKSEEKDTVCSEVWRLLSSENPKLFPPERDIWNSELYKVSPFHALGKEQLKAVNDICDNVLELLDDKPISGESLDGTTSPNRLVILEGASGTGKSIVLSTLFVQLSEVLRQRAEHEDVHSIQPNSRVCLVVNQDQQLTVYENLAKKIGLMRSASDSERCVYKATEFLNAIKDGKREQPDVVLVDEAHLLRTSTHRSYPGKRFHGNQLYDLLLSAKIVIAVFDPEQVMRKSQQWDPDVLEKMLHTDRSSEGGELTYSGVIEMQNNGNSIPGIDTFQSYHITLNEQFRIDADDNTIAWIDRLANIETVGMAPIPNDETSRDHPRGIHGLKPYDLRVYTSPVELEKALVRRRKECATRARTEREAPTSAPLCRLLATYDWPFNASTGEGAVELFRVRDAKGKARWVMPENETLTEGYSGDRRDCFSRNWNYVESGSNSDQAWSGNPEADDEVGSYFSIQGFDLNYAGVIIGPSIKYVDGKIKIDVGASCDSEVTGQYAEDLILQQFKVLIRRGIHGLYLFAVDPGLQNALEKSARASGKLDLDD